MATGRIGVTPVLRTRWSEQPTAGTTSLSGLDDNSVALVYDAGYEAVYRNGVLLSRGNDYTATDGTTITLIDATLTGDIIEVFANDLVPLTDAISKGQYYAKGALLSASAASTPAVLAVGSNNQVLTADSAEATGLKWSTPASGSMTSVASGTLSGTAVAITGIPSTYKQLRLVVTNYRPTTDNQSLRLRVNNDSTANSYMQDFSSGYASAFSSALWNIASDVDNGASQGIIVVDIYAYNDATWKMGFVQYINNNATTPTSGSYGVNFLYYNNTTTISQLNLFNSGGGNFTSGNYVVYGVN